MMFNKNLYVAEIYAHGENLAQAASVIGCCESWHSQKINGKADFTREEIQAYRDHYGCTDEKTIAIFFGT